MHEHTDNSNRNITPLNVESCKVTPFLQQMKDKNKSVHSQSYVDTCFPPESSLLKCMECRKSSILALNLIKSIFGEKESRICCTILVIRIDQRCFNIHRLSSEADTQEKQRQWLESKPSSCQSNTTGATSGHEYTHFCIF